MARRPARGCSRSAANARPYTAQSDGYFRNIEGATLIPKRFLPVHARTTSARCSLSRDVVTKKADKIGDRKIKAITPISADKIYERIILAGPDGERPRQAEKAVTLCRRAWNVVHRLYPSRIQSRRAEPVERRHHAAPRQRQKVLAVTRDDVYTFAWERNRKGMPRGGCCGGYLLRVAPAARKCVGRRPRDGRTTAAKNGRAL